MYRLLPTCIDYISYMRSVTQIDFLGGSQNMQSFLECVVCDLVCRLHLVLATAHDGHCKYNVTFRRVGVTIVAVEKQ
jgi:hypothetical protein